jgi:hypothetical protein
VGNKEIMLKNAVGKFSGIPEIQRHIRDFGVKNAECCNVDFFLVIKGNFFLYKEIAH